MAVITECPSCNAVVPQDAASCPQCGVVFAADEGPHESLPDAKPDSEKPRRMMRERILFYAGLAMVLLGGPAIAVGSWLHDFLRLPFGGEAYSEFGWFNRAVSAIGLVLLLTGIMTLILSLRLSRPVGDDYDIGANPESRARE